MTTTTLDPVIERIAEDLAGIEDRVARFSLSDAIRLGAEHSTQAYGWGSGEDACALTAALMAARAAGMA